jgi:hypothetical protein
MFDIFNPTFRRKELKAKILGANTQILKHDFVPGQEAKTFYRRVTQDHPNHFESYEITPYYVIEKEQPVVSRNSSASHNTKTFY